LTRPVAVGDACRGAEPVLSEAKELCALTSILLDYLRMATETPARVLGLENELGVLKPGAKADIVICDEHISVWKVIVGGDVVFAANT
jgi:N-acetylglucosamine-6-phosphate deacetylase